MEAINNLENSVQSKKQVPWLTISLLLIIIILTGCLGYLYFSGKILLDGKDRLNLSDVNEDKETELMETYEFEYSYGEGFSLQYPKDWEITKEKTTCDITDPESGEEICTYHELVISYISNPDYFFSISMCSECSPGMYCEFTDSNNQDEGIEGIEFDNFKEFGNENYRRAWMDGDKSVAICKRVEDTLYHTGRYSISYNFPENPNENLLKVMDNIVLSIR